MTRSPADPDLRVLGPVVVRGPAGPTAPGSARTRELLVALALAHGRPLSPGALADDLWSGDDAPLDPRAALQTLVSRVRRVLAPGLVASSPAGYAFTGGTDLAHADAALRAARAALGEGRPDDAVALARDGLALWRGEVGGDLPTGSVLAARLEAAAGRARDGLAHTLLDATDAAGDLEGAVALATELLAARPTDEPVAARLMTTLARTGRTNDALRVFASVRDALADELGADPSPTLGALHLALLRSPGAVVDPAVATPGLLGPAPGSTTAGPSSLVVGGAPASGTTSGRTSGKASGTAVDSATCTSTAVLPGRRGVAIGLRAAADPLVGRARDVAAVAGLLDDGARLVTVLGPGGLGKTRLAQEVAAGAVRDAPLVAVVELAGVRSDDDVVLAVGTALGVSDVQRRQVTDPLPEIAPTRERIVERLSAPGTLLVLDNCEHLLDGVTGLVAEVLERTPTAVLTTSRAPLDLPAEVVYPLPALAARTSGAPAVELFERRARAARPDVDLPRDVVERLCEHLDGLPLAIELAAVRTRTMTVQELENRLTARFGLLTSRDRTAPERHRTLRAVIEWSWNLLAPRERAALRRLALLPDAAPASAVHAVLALDAGSFDAGSFDAGSFDAGSVDAAAQALDVVDALVAQSMLVPVAASSGTTRYRMLETVREFALLELAAAREEDATRVAVSAWAVALADDAVARLRGSGQAEAARTLLDEQDNLVQVLRWALEREDRAVAGPTFAALAQLWLLRGTFSELVDLGPAVGALFVGVEVGDDELDAAAWATLADVLATVFEGVRRPHDPVPRAAARLHRVARRAAALAPTARAFVLLGDAMVRLGPRDQAALAPVLARLAADDAWEVRATGAVFAAQLAENAGDLERSRALQREAFDAAVAADDRWFAAVVAQARSELELQDGRPLDALGWDERARELAAPAGELWAEGNPFGGQAETMRRGALVWLGRGGEVRGVLEADAAVPAGGVPAGGVPATDRTTGPGPLRDEVLGRRMFSLFLLGQDEFVHGRTARALELIGQAVGLATPARQDGHQGRLLWGAASLAVAHLAPDADGVPDPAELERWARDLVAVARATLRVPAVVDMPVLGAAALALGTQLVVTPGAGRVDDGLELLGLAALLGSRQDAPSLDRARHRDLAVRTVGEIAVRAGERRAGAVAPGRRIARLGELLDARPWGASHGTA